MTDAGATVRRGRGDRAWADDASPAINPVAELAAAWAADAEAAVAGDPQLAMFETLDPPALLMPLPTTAPAASPPRSWAEPDAVPARRPRRSRGVVVSDVDLQWLRWLGRYRYASTLQLAEAFGVALRRVQRRVARLEEIGLVTRRAWVTDAGSIIVPTAEGMRMALLDLPTPEMTPGTARHEMTVISLAINWEAHGLTVITDREIRASLSPTRPLTAELAAAAELAELDVALRPMFAVYQGSGERARHARALLAAAAAGDAGAAKALGGDASTGYRSARVQWHVPDLVVVRAPREGRSFTVAIEVELNHKQQSDYRRIFAAYADPLCGGGTGAGGLGGYGGVKYFVQSAAQQNALSHLASRMGLSTLIEVNRLDDAHLPGLPADLFQRGGGAPLRRRRQAVG